MQQDKRNFPNHRISAKKMRKLAPKQIQNIIYLYIYNLTSTIHHNSTTYNLTALSPFIKPLSPS